MLLAIVQQFLNDSANKSEHAEFAMTEYLRTHFELSPSNERFYQKVAPEVRNHRISDNHSCQFFQSLVQTNV